MSGPDFLIIGAAKSGTTSLLKDLLNHPEVSMQPHEVNYFTHFYANGPGWYNGLFMQPDKIQGEKSTSYLYNLYCHERIFQFKPCIKHILLLREPVSRAFSNWTMRYTQGRLLKQVHLFNQKYPNQILNMGFPHLLHQYLNTTDETEKREEPFDIFERGLYLRQIHHLLRFFSRDQLLILVSEKYFREPSQVRSTIGRFLSIGDFPEGGQTWERRSTYSVSLGEDARNELGNYYRSHNQELFDFLGFEIREWKRKI